MPKKQDDSSKVDQLHKMRHSAAHLLAAAVQKLYPHVKFGVGPVIEHGFYYDIDFGNEKISNEDLMKIEGEMEMLKKAKLSFERQEMSVDNAIKFFTKSKQDYKVELLKDIKKYGTTVFKEIENAKDVEQEIVGTVSLYKTGDFIDLCRGPHVENSGEVGHFKLTTLAGAYWRGSEKNPMLTRVYGVAFETKAELEAYVAMMEEAKKRDHRKLGKDLDLFFFAEEVGPGLPMYTDKGTTVRREIERFVIDEELKRGYLHVCTPDLARVKLYEISGHYPYYKESMYPVMQVDGDELVLRPMTCPHHFMVFKSKMRSYRELPMRIAEIAKLYRYEKSGELSGLLRVRSFSLADSHIFCRKTQASAVVKEVIDLIEFMASTFGLKKGEQYWYRLSLGDRNNKEKYYDDPKSWEEGEALLRSVLDEIDAPYEEALDEAAFYGPKIDIQMKNVNGKEDTAFTVQYDFCLPARFGIEYTNEQGQPEQPVAIHRSSVGAIERTMAFLIEHYAGAFPLWLSPVQVVLATVAESYNEFAGKIAREMKAEGLRIEVDDANETVGNKIRKAAGQKIPYTLVIGEKEAGGGDLMVRERGVEKQYSLSKAEFVEKVKKEIKERSNS